MVGGSQEHVNRGTTGLPTKNLEDAIFPFGFYLEGVESVDRGWTLQVHDYYNDKTYWNLFVSDFTDKNVSSVIQQIGVLQ